MKSYEVRGFLTNVLTNNFCTDQQISEELEMFGAKKAKHFQDFARFNTMFIELICHNMLT